MIWDYFVYFAIVIILLWLSSIALFYLPNIKSEIISQVVASIGVVLLIIFTSILWVQLDRPPLRTLGETRLWYSLFLPLIGIISFYRWKYKWFFAFSLLLAALFLFINVLHPENFSKTLMPALQSPWFIPHVVVYIFAYALLAASSLVGLKGLWQIYTSKFDKKTLLLADNLVYLGFAFLTAGLIFGALWAKEAWGHYWTWDPKETWAFLSWVSYLIYIHFTSFHKQKAKMQLWILSIAFVVLLICWFGINYLPAAQNSIHVYGG